MLAEEPEWFVCARDVALGLAAADTLERMQKFARRDQRFDVAFDVLSLPNEVLQHFECTDWGAVWPLRRGMEGLDKGDAQRALYVINKIAGSCRATEVWRSLERFGTPPPRFVIQLSLEIWRALHDFEKDAITSNELKAASARIRTLALKLADELASPAVRSSLDRVNLQVKRRRKMMGREISGGYPSVQDLGFLAEAATLTPSLTKLVGQPNSDGARRLYFIRHLTQRLNAWMGTPMRSQVLALTGVFFETDDLTPQMLATLAPVKKQVPGDSV